jgi:acetoin utilization protein AcuB
MLSDRDLYKALGPKSNSRVIEDATGANASELYVATKKVRHIMRRGVITVKRDTPASEAAALMADVKIGALPVVDKDNRLVGILSATDLLRVFSKIDKAGDGNEVKSRPAKTKVRDSEE